jgi:hypothetical protein
MMAGCESKPSLRNDRVDQSSPLSSSGQAQLEMPMTYHRDIRPGHIS